MSVFSRLYLFLAFFCGAVCPVVAVEVKTGPMVHAAETSAGISWVTDVECGTMVRFGTVADQLIRKVEGDVGVNHAVQLTALKPGTTYYFSIGTAKKALQNGSFQTKGDVAKSDTSAKPAQTKPVEPKPAVKPAAKPTVPSVAVKPTYTPPPTAKTWGDRRSLQDHFDRHGKDFNSKDPDHYAAQAWIFLQRAMDEGLPAKQDESDGTLRVWESKTRAFAAYNANFTTKTYFRPNSPDYFSRQPGKPVRLRRAAPK